MAVVTLRATFTSISASFYFNIWVTLLLTLNSVVDFSMKILGTDLMVWSEQAVTMA